MLKIEIAKMTVLTAIEKGFIDPEKLQDFIDMVFGQGIFTFNGLWFRGLIYTVKTDDFETVLLTDNGAAELEALRLEHGEDRQEIIDYQIQLWNAHKANLTLCEQLTAAEDKIEKYESSFDRRLNDARNLIESYEAMVSKFESIQTTARTIMESSGFFEDDIDSVLVFFTLIVHMLDTISTNPTDYDPIPF